MKHIYKPAIDELIIQHEEKMKSICRSIIEPYVDKFAGYGVELVYSFFWYNSIKKESSTDKRLPFRSGYDYIFTAEIDKDGEIFRYDDGSGEEGYAVLLYSCNISSISRLLFVLNVTLVDDTSDIIEELDDMLKIVKSLNLNK